MNSNKPCESCNKKVVPIAGEGLRVIAISVFITVYLGALGFTAIALFCGALTIFFVSFFRDPERDIPDEAGAIVSPADGKVVDVRVMQDQEYSGEEMLKISIFMNVFNVHVNRMPADATVKKIDYFPGKFFNASLDKASKDNERNAVYVALVGGQKAVVVQIAGLIARRIVCKVSTGDTLRRGERFGIICFGSRVDLYLPPEAAPAVAVGDKVLAGATIVGHLS